MRQITQFFLEGESPTLKLWEQYFGAERNLPIRVLNGYIYLYTSLFWRQDIQVSVPFYGFLKFWRQKLMSMMEKYPQIFNSVDSRTVILSAVVLFSLAFSHGFHFIGGFTSSDSCWRYKTNRKRIINSHVQL